MVVGGAQVAHVKRYGVGFYACGNEPCLIFFNQVRGEPRKSDVVKRGETKETVECGAIVVCCADFAEL